jgi:thiamine-phosphate diphosphorylase
MAEPHRKIGFYPIIDSFEWVAKLAPLGIQSIQLRIKDKPLDIIELEIIKSIKLAKQYNCQLFINDYWELAIKHHAFGIHLGQEDLVTADIKLIHQADIKLGISTHNDKEISRALSHDPYYLAYGPIYETTTKAMHYSPRGTNRLTYWVDAINLPIIAIGGINLQNIDDVLRTGVDGVAVISAITQAADYTFAMNEFKSAMFDLTTTPCN